MTRRRDRAALSTLLRIRQGLDSTSVPRVLQAGARMVLFARDEEGALGSLYAFLDPTVRAELTAEHREIEEDLNLLEWLQRTAPDSTDASTLAASLASRMCRHIDRDARLLQRASAIRSDA